MDKHVPAIQNKHQCDNDKLEPNVNQHKPDYLNLTSTQNKSKQLTKIHVMLALDCPATLKVLASASNSNNKHSELPCMCIRAKHEYTNTSIIIWWTRSHLHSAVSMALNAIDATLRSPNVAQSWKQHIHQPVRRPIRTNHDLTTTRYTRQAYAAKSHSTNSARIHTHTHTPKIAYIPRHSILESSFE